MAGEIAGIVLSKVYLCMASFQMARGLSMLAT
jgi:hypothetical protein